MIRLENTPGIPGLTGGRLQVTVTTVIIAWPSTR